MIALFKSGNKTLVYIAVFVWGNKSHKTHVQHTGMRLYSLKHTQKLCIDDCSTQRKGYRATQQ